MTTRVERSGLQVDAALAAFDLAALADLPVAVLSSGQKHRAGLARVHLRQKNSAKFLADLAMIAAAKEIGRDFKLPTLERDDFAGLEKMVDEPFAVSIALGISVQTLPSHCA